MYKLVYGCPSCHIVLFQGSIEECKRWRVLAGDIVLDSDGNIVQGDEWLWEREKANPDCYAREMQHEGWIY